MEFPSIPISLAVKRFDYALFVIYEAKDFPDLPYLALLLDGMHKERGVILDCTGRYNDATARPGDQRQVAADITQARNTLGLTHEHPLPPVSQKWCIGA